LRRGDVVVDVDGEPVVDPADFRAKLRAAHGRVVLGVQRSGAHLRMAFDAGAARGVD
jgi:hypothetical protein